MVDLDGVDIKELVCEKMRVEGVSSLRDAELLALVLARGTLTNESLARARALVRRYGSWEQLSSTDPHRLRKEASLTEAQAGLIASVAELGRRAGNEKRQEIEVIRNNLDVERIFRPMLARLDHEEFWLVCLNTSNRVIDKVRIGQGGVDGVLVDIKILMRNVLDKLASSVIIVHNHPSGLLEPSGMDIDLTRKIRAAAGLFDIRLLDHVIVGEQGSVSVMEYL